MGTENKIGIKTYLSKTPGTGGKIKTSCEDFLVEEITPAGVALEYGKENKFSDLDGEYTHFTVEKENWDSMRAAKMIAKAAGVSQKRVNYAGTKDKRARTTQRMSIWKVQPEKLQKISFEGLVLKDFSKSSVQVGLGELLGNRFSIVIEDVSKDAKTRVGTIAKELNGKAPNFFGPQRFGNRANNHLIGKALLLGDIKGATMEFLTGEGDNREDTALARKNLKETLDYKRAFEEFPNYLGYEKAIINSLAKEPTDFARALNTLPKKLRTMFIHAYQGYLFNSALSDCLLEGNVPKELPLVGTNIAPTPEMEEILSKDGVNQDSFRLARLPTLASEGQVRESMMEFNDLSVLDFNESASKITVRFSLGPGRYATTLLREITKN